MGLLRCWGQAGGGGVRKGIKISLHCQAGLKGYLSWHDLPSVTCLTLPRSPLLARRFVKCLAAQAQGELGLMCRFSQSQV